MPKGCLLVRAIVAEDDRPRFDEWYRDEHLPQAKAAFGAERAWRGWSRTSPGEHVACYEFATLAEAEALATSAALAGMVAEFDRCWGGRVTRSRDILEVAA